MRARWKIQILSPRLYKFFFLRRPNSPLISMLGRNINPFATTVKNWDRLMERFTRKRFLVKPYDLILPIYRGRKFWIWSGKRIVPIIVDFIKIGDTFGMYRYTKRYSPIHRGTGFVFKDIRKQMRGSNKSRKKKFNFANRSKWGKMLKKKSVVKNFNKRSTNKSGIGSIKKSR